MTQAMAKLLLRRIDDEDVANEFVVCRTRLIRRASA
jgi:DNA-binding LacI/PurR family transcriptional regulator